MLDNNARLILELEAYTNLIQAIEDFENWIADMIEGDDFQELRTAPENIIFYNKTHRDFYEDVLENASDEVYAHILNVFLAVFIDKVSSKIKPKS